MKKNIFSFFSKKNNEPEIKNLEDISLPIEKIEVEEKIVVIEEEKVEEPVEEILVEEVIEEPVEEKPEEKMPQKPTVKCGSLAGADLKRQLRMGNVSNLDMYRLANQKK